MLYHDDIILSQADRDKVSAAQNAYKAAAEKGDKASMQSLHDFVESIRSGYGYSGGADGSEYIPLETEGKTGAAVGSASAGSYYVPVSLPRPADQSDLIRALYAAQQEAVTGSLQGTYDKNAADLDAEAASLPEAYRRLADAAYVQSRLDQKNLDERYQAAGLSSGAQGQAARSLGNQLQGELSDIALQRQSALDAVAQRRQALTEAYRTAVAEAIANNDLAKARALYEEAVRLDDASSANAYKEAQLNYDYAKLGLDADRFNADMKYQLDKDYADSAAAKEAREAAAAEAAAKLQYQYDALAAKNGGKSGGGSSGGSAGGGNSSYYDAVAKAAKTYESPTAQRTYLNQMAQKGYISEKEADNIYYAVLGNKDI